VSLKVLSLSLPDDWYYPALWLATLGLTGSYRGNPGSYHGQLGYDYKDYA